MTAHASLPKSRVEAFSDGVIAIIVTILVLEIKVPKLDATHSDAALREALVHAIPLVLAYLVSFAVLLVFWVSHHQLLHSMRRVDRNVLWLNGLFLMVLAFVPAPTAILGEYPQAPTGTMLYGVVMTLAGLSFAALRGYITRHGALLHEAVSPVAARRAVQRGLLSPALYAIGAACAWVDTRLAWLVFALVPLIFILPGAFERSVPDDD